MKRLGFTLIEILVVITIIVILAGLIVVLIRQPHEGEVLVKKKEHRLSSLGVNTYYIYIEGESDPIETNKFFYEKVCIGDTIHVYIDRSTKSGRRLDVVLESRTEKLPLHVRCKRAFLLDCEVSEEEHIELLDSPEYRQKWENFRTEWASKLVAKELK